MSEDKSTPNNPVSALIDKLVGPVYDDLLRPVVQEVGKGIGGLASYYMHGWQVQGTIAKANLNLLEETLKPKLEAIPEEKRIPVDPAILVPTLQIASYSAQHETLKDMFANLLASAGNSDKSNLVHSSFVEIIKQLSPLDANIIKDFKARNRAHIPIVKLVLRIDNTESDSVLHITDIDNLSSTWEEIAISLENLRRLGIIQITYDRWLSQDLAYKPIIDTLHKHNNEITDARISGTFITSLESNVGKVINPQYQPGICNLTPLGNSFKSACVT